MFLLQECGPTAFMVKVADAEDGEEGADGAEHRSGEGAHGGRNRRAGDQGKKFKVQIGGSMECSCKSKGELPCVHLLFVLVKLLRVPMENPLVWQASLLDGEVEQILRGRFKPMAEKKKKPDAHTDAVERKEIDEDDICAICQVLCAIGLCHRYVLFGTEVAFAGTRRVFQRAAMCSRTTPSIALRACSAVSSTDL